MLHTPAPFPHAGAICFRKDTAEPALILQCNRDGSVLLQRRRRLFDGTTVPLEGASANVTVPLEEIFAEPELAIHRGRRPRRRSDRR